MNDKPTPAAAEQPLTEWEWQALERLAGNREFKWGSCVGACLEVLKARGFCTRMPYRITDAGREALRQRKEAASS